MKLISNLKKFIYRSGEKDGCGLCDRLAVGMLCMLVLFPFDYIQLSAMPALPERKVMEVPDSEVKEVPSDSTVYMDVDMEVRVPTDRQPLESDYNASESDTIPTVVTSDTYLLEQKRPFNPSPERAVWLSALFPGLGQIYNRRYWKLPIVVGGFMGLAYATSWNNGQYQDYIQGYQDLLDSDPSTNSYMDFFPPTTTEDDLDKTWLTSLMKTRKDYYRRNRDLCIIFLVALYLVCMVDAYVDASLAHFDISPNLSMDWSPALIDTRTSKKPAVGLNCALTF